MSESAELLHQLRLDRTEPQKRIARGWTLGWVAGVALASAGASAWWIHSQTGAAVRADKTSSQPTAKPPVMPRPGKPSSLEASGYVVARRQATVSADTTGRLREVLVEEGQHVAAGQIIARLDDSKARAALEEATARLAQAQADLDAARTAADYATPIFRRTEKQYASGFISAQAFDSARQAYQAAQADRVVKERALDVMRAVRSTAQRNCEETIVRAPFAGMITVKAAQPGEIVSPLSASGGFARTGIGTIVDMDSLEVEVDVSETSIGGIRPGQAATIRPNAYPDWNIPAEAIAIIPTADRARATVKVRVGFKAIDARILPDMGVHVSFTSS